MYIPSGSAIKYKYICFNPLMPGGNKKVTHTRVMEFGMAEHAWLVLNNIQHIFW